jgi:FkbM family methyltransferase
MAELRLHNAGSAPFRREGNFIIDVGMNDGSDTAYYLHCGFGVIAIEADPRLAEAARRRFAREIEAGKLALLNLGIAPTTGAADFHLATNHQRSSFSTDVVSRRGMQIVETVRVPCAPLSAVIQQYGVPYYIKVDVEGNDLYCLESLSKIATPPYLSVDFSHGTEHKLLDCLLDLEADEVLRRHAFLREAYDKPGAVFLWDLHARM